MAVVSGGFPVDSIDDNRKLAFCLEALDAQDPFALEAKIPGDVYAANKLNIELLKMPLSDHLHPFAATTL